MAGIIANSQTRPMLGAETAADKAVSGYLTAEMVTLSTTPTGTTYEWGLAIPQSSSPGRSALSDTDVASPTFTPDVAGTYAVTCVVDSTTTYVIRLTVTQLAASTVAEALRLPPVADNAIEAPALGMALYYSSDQDALCVKDASGDVFTVDLTAVP